MQIMTLPRSERSTLSGDLQLHHASGYETETTPRTEGVCTSQELPDSSRWAQ